jgi:EAL domain-containing protein (putative c-di-GMP-specific phosphodiesterase class I)
MLATADAAVSARGHALGLCMVADGIDTPAQQELLAGIGCDEGQGQLFSRPMSLVQPRRFPVFDGCGAAASAFMAGG